LREFLDELTNSGMSAASVSRCVASLHTFFRYLLREDVVLTDPSMNITAPRHERRSPEILTPDEVRRLMEQPKTGSFKGLRDRAMLETLYSTGIRVSELINLTMDQVDVKKRNINCVSGKKSRVIPLSDKALQALNEYMSVARVQMMRNKNETRVFVNCTGTSMSRQGFWKIVKEYSKSADIQSAISPHSLRHSFAAHALADGANIEQLKEVMGHSDISATQVYLRAIN
jgi:integrase/recombinase XerD